MGKALRIYCSNPYKGAYVFIDKEKVTHASAALAFTIGWPESKVRERAAKVGFKLCTIVNMTSPNPTWTNKKPKKGVKNVD